ncbi:ankyrin repeat domain-containing protein 50 [Conger conger]|uniref:ankyrin repeat domain-containing protein 50 n=1 Tax=Conger conger TaxID=82655 RepID=UPI002A598B22|nr:ankyrin repeat domain-containing protein 50 [Conger conger]XP_061091868.1 ankyrin repeat domain-containing protein 50 [Conger conger]XP_061091869.1 ankyrin repeat domain-containing protein 50 [Conger conger]XP_061091870.1 ankyrin repeat domain-containing protein 50 [Conger conger]XP_061091871.1 ankyrin repeat domain-containing protein 50 [Conger conger]XP_061091872.1 ankyrin repeat domain-containing protein 50 [Conger conger]
MSDGGSGEAQGRPFHCREWALGKLQHWLGTRCQGALVTGGPGAGKTALCTEAVRPTSKAGLEAGLAPCCLASHFCRWEDERSVEVWRFVLGLVEQLRGSPLLPPGYAQTLDTPTIALTLDPLHCQRDPDDTFRRAVLLPLQETPPPAHRLFLLVDSLDSGSQGGGVVEGRSSSIAELLSRNHHLFPSWLLLICSVRRQNRAVYHMFSGFRKLVLDDLRKASAVHDVQRYILRRLDQEGALRRHLTPETAEMLNLLHIKSGGCFLFLERVLDGVSRGLLAVREIRHIPGTLNGLYLWLCQRLFPTSLFSQVRPLLNALLASLHPLTPELLYRALWTRDPALGPDEFRHRLDAVSPLLTEGDAGAVFLFHASFAEWLTDVKYCTQRYLCSMEDGHALLAMSLSLRASQLTTPEICQLANHLLRSGIHTSDPALLALWMVCTGVPAVGDDSVSQTSPPVLVQPDVFQLLLKSGVHPPSYGSGFGVHCLEGVGGGVLGKLPEGAEFVRLLLDGGASVDQVDPVDGRTLLASAAHSGAVDAVELLLSRGGDPTLADHQGQTPLTLAARQGHLGALRALLDWPGCHKAMLEHVDGEGWTALRLAAWGGHGEAVRLLLDAGAEVDGSDADGRTALRAAAWAGHQEMVLALLEHGGQPDKADREGRTPLIAAAYMGHREAVEALLVHGARVDAHDSDGRTALCVAAMCVPAAAGGRGHGDVVSALLERGADPSHRDSDGMTPLLLAAYEGQAQVLELLLEAGADVDESAGLRGNASAAVTPLLAAASMGHGAVVSTALFWGATADAIDGEGRTALSLAAARGSVEVVRALLDRGLDENHKDHLGWTPLHAAACEGHRAVCAALTECGSLARVAEPDNEGRTPLVLAAQEGHCGTARLLLDRRSPIDHRGYDGRSALSAAALEGHSEAAELLMRRGADTDVRDAEGRPLLYLLVLEGRLDMAALLVREGGAPLESRDSEGRTALHAAAWRGSPEAVGLLLRSGADPDARDKEGRPPLHSAAWQGQAAVARLLLDSGGATADLACRQQGATALCIAAQEGHADVVAVLLERGANPRHTDRYGRRPAKVAGKRGYTNIVRLLESHGAESYAGILPLPSPASPPFQTSTLQTQSSASSGSSAPHKAPPSTSSLSCSPSSTAERFHSAQSSTCHSLATVQTAPADSLSFTQLIQQHSLPRSRPSTLPLPTSAHNSLPHPQAGSPPADCNTNTPSHMPRKGLSSPGDKDWPKIQPKTQEVNSAGLEREERRQGKWNSVMASLGVSPGQDCPTRTPKTRDGPLHGYPVQLEGQELQRDGRDTPRKSSLSPPFSFPSPSALSPECIVPLTSTDPQLNLKQAIKLQFEGPTSAAIYKRETPL